MFSTPDWTALIEIITGGESGGAAVVRLWAGGRSGERSGGRFFSLNIMKTGEVSGDWRLSVRRTNL